MLAHHFMWRKHSSWSAAWVCPWSYRPNKSKYMSWKHRVQHSIRTTLATYVAVLGFIKRNGCIDPICKSRKEPIEGCIFSRERTTSLFLCYEYNSVWRENMRDSKIPWCNPTIEATCWITSIAFHRAFFSWVFNKERECYTSKSIHLRSPRVKYYR